MTQTIALTQGKAANHTGGASMSNVRLERPPSELMGPEPLTVEEGLLDDYILHRGAEAKRALDAQQTPIEREIMTHERANRGAQNVRYWSYIVENPEAGQGPLVQRWLGLAQEMKALDTPEIRSQWVREYQQHKAQEEIGEKEEAP